MSSEDACVTVTLQDEETGEPFATYTYPMDA